MFQTLRWGGGGYSEPWQFWHMLDKTKVSHMVKTHILSFMPPSLLAHFKGDRERISLKRAKSGGVIKDKMCVLTKQDTFVLSHICQKCQFTQIKAFLWFELKEEYKQPPLFVFFSLIPKHKNNFIWVPWHYMRDKTKVSYIFKIQILFFMTLTLFAHILGDSINLSKYAQKG